LVKKVKMSDLLQNLLGTKLIFKVKVDHRKK